jgi:hypothetical protein
MFLTTYWNLSEILVVRIIFAFEHLQIWAIFPLKSHLSR